MLTCHNIVVQANKIAKEQNIQININTWYNIAKSIHEIYSKTEIIKENPEWLEYQKAKYNLNYSQWISFIVIQVTYWQYNKSCII